MIDSPPIIQGLHLDPKRKTQSAQVCPSITYRFELQPFTTTVKLDLLPEYTVDQSHLGMQSEAVLMKIQHAASLLLQAAQKHTVTSIVLKWIHIIGKRRETNPTTYKRAVMAT